MRNLKLVSVIYHDNSRIMNRAKKKKENLCIPFIREKVQRKVLCEIINEETINLNVLKVGTTL